MNNAAAIPSKVNGTSGLNAFPIFLIIKLESLITPNTSKIGEIHV